MTAHGVKLCRRFPEKVRFFSFDAADRAGCARGKKPYRCPACGDFHLTSLTTETAVEKRRVIRALHELRRKNVTGPLRDAAEARAKALGLV